MTVTRTRNASADGQWRHVYVINDRCDYNRTHTLDAVGGTVATADIAQEDMRSLSCDSLSRKLTREDFEILWASARDLPVRRDSVLGGDDE
mgnify:CR=1 FL=1